MPDGIRDALKRLRAEKAPAGGTIRDSLRQLRSQPPAAPPVQEPEGVFSSFQTGVAGPLLRNVVETAADLYNAPGETLERAGRGALEFLAAFDPAGNAYKPTVEGQAARVAELNRRADERLPEPIKSMKAGLAIEEAKPRTTAGRIARGAGSILGEVAFPTAPETVAGNVVTAPFGGAAARSASVAFKAGVNSVKRVFGKGAAQVIEAEATPAAVAQVRREIGEPPPIIEEVAPSPVPTVNPLPTVYAKLGTDNVEQIGAMIANANRRFGKKRTPEQIQSSMDDYRALQQLTPDEQRALSQVLPERAVSPVGEFPQGRYSRDIGDIPASEPNPQVDANLRQLEGFFESEGRALQAAEDAAIMGDIGPGAFGGQAMSPARVSAADLITTPPPTVGRIAAETGPPALSADLGISTPAPSVRAASAGATGPRADLDALNVSIKQAADSLPTPIAERVKNEFLGGLGALKSLKSALDISAPFRQGGLLLLRPLQWRQAGKAWGNMFKAFKTKNFDDINAAIAAHPDAPAMKDAGLYLANRADDALNQGEEAFIRRSGSKISDLVGRTPGIKQSNQAYTAYLDTARVEAFSQYKRVIDRTGLSPEETAKAYKAAAQWINVTTGRGSLGQRIDRSFDALSFFLFSPRYAASRLNVLNPVMYAKNLSSPGGRVVLKQQMADLMQFAGVVAGTMYLAKSAGAEVGLRPNSPDFLKIRFGNSRYDPLAGLQQVMRMAYRVGDDIARAGRGEKPKFGQSANDIIETFLSYKLAPAPSVFRNFINQRTPDKKPFTAGGAVADLVAPIQWADFVDAWRNESFGEALKTLPGAVGIGVNQYESDPLEGALERNRPLLSEIQRLNLRIAELQRGKDKQGKPEPDAAFNARVQQFGQNFTSYGLRLIQDPRFQSASDDVKARALKRLNEKAKGLTRKEFGFAELELDPGLILDSVEK